MKSKCRALIADAFLGDLSADFTELEEPKKEKALKPGHGFLGFAYHEYCNMGKIMLSLCLLVFMSVKEGKQTNMQTTPYRHVPVAPH